MSLLPYFLKLLKAMNTNIEIFVFQIETVFIETSSDLSPLFLFGFNF